MLESIKEMELLDGSIPLDDESTFESDHLILFCQS